MLGIQWLTLYPFEEECASAAGEHLRNMPRIETGAQLPHVLGAPLRTELSRFDEATIRQTKTVAIPAVSREHAERFYLYDGRIERRDECRQIFVGDVIIHGAANL
jgi:hypothetical protein